MLNLNLNGWQPIVLAIIPGLINFGVFAYSYFHFNRTKQNTSFLLFVLLIGLWQISEGFLSMSNTTDVVGEWYRIAEMLQLFIISFGILFTLRLTGYYTKINEKLLNLLIFIPNSFFLFLVLAKLDEFTIVRSHLLNWVVNPKPTALTSVMYLWIAICGTIMAILPCLHYYKTKSISSLIISIGLTIPIVIGIVFGIIFPLLLNYDNIPLHSPMVTFFSLSALLFLKKINQPDYAPKHQWSTIIEAMSEGVLIIDNYNKIMFANEAFCELTEYSFDEIKGIEVNNVFLPVRDRYTAKAAIEKGEIKRHEKSEVEITTKTGRRKWALVSEVPYYDRKKNIIGSISIQTDITHLRETEKNLLKKEDRFRQAESIAHLGHWDLHFESGKCYWSAEACRIYGIPVEEQNNQSFEKWLKFIHPDDCDFVNNMVMESQTNLRDLSFNHRIVRPDGTVRHIHTESKFEYNEEGNPIGLFGICQDITEKTVIQNSLQETENNLKTFVNESILSIHFCDPITKKVTYVNKAFQDLLGYSASEIKDLIIYDFVDDSKENIDARFEDVKRLQKIDTCERQWKTKSGEKIYVLVNTFYAKRNGVEVVYCSANDITNRKKAEIALQETNNELETFIYKASHDLRGPLVSVIGLSNIAKVEIKDKIALNYLEMINGSINRLDYILSELMKAMQIKDMKEFNEKIHFKKLIDSALDRFKHRESFSRLKIETEILTTTAFSTNKFILDTIFQNLIENAIKYQCSHKGNSFIKIRIKEKSGLIKIIIADNGIGIDKSVQLKIFDMYFRGTGISKGSGLGLYLVKKGVEKLNGEIDVFSRVGKGSMFMVTIPSN